MMSQEKKQKIVLVTGATGSLGTAICKEMLDNDYIVCANYKTKSKAEHWRLAMENLGYRTEMYQTDVSNFDDTMEMVKAIEKDVGNIDILINNAGITRDASIRKMSFEDWDEVMRVNLYSVFNCCKAVINKMMEKNFGRIINISSVNGQRGQFGQVNYSASKAGMHGFTKSLAMEVAKKGITVNTISPGYLATEMVLAVPENIRNKIIEAIPTGRLGEPNEIARIVSFLCSDKATCITGANYTANGGYHMF